MFLNQRKPKRGFRVGSQVKCSAGQRGELTDLAHIFHGNICDVSLDTMTLELQARIRSPLSQHMSLSRCRFASLW